MSYTKKEEEEDRRDREIKKEFQPLFGTQKRIYKLLYTYKTCKQQICQ